MMTNTNIIKTKDNNKRSPYHLNKTEKDAHLTNLQKLSGLIIKDINLQGHPNLLIFPRNFETYGDKIGNEKVFELIDDNLITGNILGFIGYNGTQVFIRSRFDNDNGKDYFLNYMLQKVFGLNVFNLDTHTDYDEGLDFLIYLFPEMLKDALGQGIYREYQERHYNNYNVKGRIDIARHIKGNTPFTGNVAYAMREYVADNHVMQLIRHAIEYIRQIPMGKLILNNDDNIKKDVSTINECTPTYNRQNRQNIISQNLRPLSHPFYQSYLSLQHLCMQILRHEELKHGFNDDQIHGILFDGAWLWEEYLNTIFSKCGFVHPQNRIGQEKVRQMFKWEKIPYTQPDFYKEGSVIDAKYKVYNSLLCSEEDYENLRKDRYQLLSYMYLLKAKTGMLIVPNKGKIDERLNHTFYELNGYGGEMHLIQIPVSSEGITTYNDYTKMMETKEKDLKDIVI